MQELKLKPSDVHAAEEIIKNLGATFIEETNFTDTYFNQQPGNVFKICEDEKGFFLIQLRRTPEGKFECIKNNQIDHADQVMAEMTNEYGITCVLTGKRRTYMLDENKLTITMINGRGNFLIVTGENPTQDFVATRLGIQNPEYITVSFDELPPLSPTTPIQ